MEINISIDKEFKKQVKSARLKKIIPLILAAEETGGDAELGLVITGDEQLHELNLKYLDEDRPTDVLSFPMGEHIGDQPEFVPALDGKKHLGDIIISYPRTAIQAEEHGHSADRELLILLIHGILHLLGYDHDISEREKEMKERESTILKTIEEQRI